MTSGHCKADMQTDLGRRLQTMNHQKPQLGKRQNPELKMP